MDHMLHRNQWSKITSMPVPWYEGQRFQINLQYLNSWKTLENKTPCPSSLYSSNNYYLNNAASIDIHTHYRKSSCGMEDANPHKRQFAGTLGFCFTNACLVMKFFAKSDLPHHEFKTSVALALTMCKTANLCQTRNL